MNCKEVLEKTYDYIEHQLSQKELEEFEEHMKNCKTCREEYYKLEKVIIKLKNIRDIEPPEDLKYKILNSIKKEEKTKSKILYFKKYYYMAAACLITFIGASFLIKILSINSIKSDIYSVNSEQSNQDTKQQIKINKSPTTKIEQTPKLVENIPKVANNESNTYIDNNVSIFNSKNSDDDYFYEKIITEENNIKIFKHDVALYKNKTCNVYFENTSNEDILMYVEDIDGNKVNEDTLIKKGSNNTMKFCIPEDRLDQDVYTINIEATDKNVIIGYLKIEILKDNIKS